MATAATPIDGLDEVELTLTSRLHATDWDNNTPGTYSDVFPVTTIDDIRYGYDEGVDTLVDEAMFRAWDAESSIGRRPGGARITGELLPISRKIPMSEYAQLRSFRGQDAIVERAFADAPRLGRGILARLVRARYQLLLTGKVSINENRLKDEYDSGRDGSLTIGAVDSLWSVHDEATPIADVLGWKNLAVALNEGLTFDTMDVTETVMAHLQLCDEVRGGLSPVDSVPARVPRSMVVDAFREIAGITVNTITPPVGMLPSPMPTNMVILRNASVPLGATTMGTPVEARRPRYAGLPSLPGIVAGGWENEDPPTAWTHAVGIGLPLLGAPNLTLSAQVLA